MKTVTLHPDGPFTELPRSDTIFGAICWGIRLHKGNETLKEHLAKFRQNKPPFRISSAYPVIHPDNVDDYEELHLLPRPKVPLQPALPKNPTNDEIKAVQRWQQIRFLPHNLFHKITAGELTKSQILNALSTQSETISLTEFEYYLIDEFLLPRWAEETIQTQKPLIEENRMRNSVNRLSNATEGQLFHDTSIYTAKNVSFGLAIQGDTKSALTGLAAIQDHGIGGGKSVGKGTFQLGEMTQHDWDEANNTGQRDCTLSFCIPREEHLDSILSNGYYEIETRKGVLEQSFVNNEDESWKKRVLGVTEGSILPSIPQYIGHNPVVANHFESGVQQYGYECTVNISDSLF